MLERSFLLLTVVLGAGSGTWEIPPHRDLARIYVAAVPDPTAHLPSAPSIALERAVVSSLKEQGIVALSPHVGANPAPADLLKITAEFEAAGVTAVVGVRSLAASRCSSLWSEFPAAIQEATQPSSGISPATLAQLQTVVKAVVAQQAEETEDRLRAAFAATLSGCRSHERTADEVSRFFLQTAVPGVIVEVPRNGPPTPESISHAIAMFLASDHP